MTENSLPPLLELLNGIETDSGLSVCLKVLAPSASAQKLLAPLPKTYGLHLTRFCRSVKLTRNEQCRQCDLRDVPTLASRLPLPFVNRCHADASEIIIPIPLRGNLVALGFLGQFREAETQPEALPLLPAEQVRSLLRQALLLQRYVLYELEHSADGKGEDVLREHLIHRFLQENIKRNPALGDLARTLGLSTSRTGHLIKELTGQSFVELKLQHRLKVACKLLSTTLLTIEHIAEETGFSDPRYFYRVFTNAMGMPPARWRASQRKATKLQA